MHQRVLSSPTEACAVMRPVLQFLVVTLLVIQPLHAQLSLSGLPVTGWASDVALSGAGAVDHDDMTRSIANPAVFPTNVHLGIIGAVAQGGVEGDLQSFRVGSVILVGQRWLISGSFASRQLRDLLDDPTIPDAGLRVGDTEITAGVGFQIAGIPAVSIGLKGQAAFSEVFDTKASAYQWGLSTSLSPVSWATVLIAVDMPGGDAEYRTGVGTTITTPSHRTLTVAGGIRVTPKALIQPTVFFDYRTEEHWKRASLGLSVRVGEFATVRTGVALDRSSFNTDSRWKVVPAVGGAVRISGFQLEAAYSGRANPDDLAPRVLIGLGWGTN